MLHPDTLITIFIVLSGLFSEPSQYRQQIKNDNIANNTLEKSARAQSLNNGLNLMNAGLEIARAGENKLFATKPIYLVTLNVIKSSLKRTTI